MTARRPVAVNLSRVEARLIDLLLDVYIDSQDEIGAKGEAALARRARKQLTVAIRRSTTVTNDP